MNVIDSCTDRSLNVMLKIGLVSAKYLKPAKRGRGEAVESCFERVLARGHGDKRVAPGIVGVGDTHEAARFAEERELGAGEPAARFIENGTAELEGRGEGGSRARVRAR